MASSTTYSKSGSSDTAASGRSQAPLADQRSNRRQTLLQLPGSAGRSRHGAPVRAIQSTASTKRRLSLPLAPGSPGLPGASGAIRSHCASVRQVRATIPSASAAASMEPQRPNVHTP